MSYGETTDRDIERVTDLQQKKLETAVKEITERPRQCDLPQFKDWDRKHCFDCDVEMHQARIDDGRVRCTDCQTEAENRGERA